MPQHGSLAAHDTSILSLDSEIIVINGSVDCFDKQQELITTSSHFSKPARGRNGSFLAESRVEGHNPNQSLMSDEQNQSSISIVDRAGSIQNNSISIK